MEPEKPILMRRNEFIEDVTRAVNGHDLPPIVIEPILADLLNETRAAMNQQYNEQMREYHAALEKAKTMAVEVTDNG